MRPNARIVMVALALTLGAGYTSQTVAAAAAQTAPASATRKGVIKKIDDTTIVMTPADDKKKEVSYALAPSAKRTGQCDVGDDVVVSYHYEKGKAVVTTVAGK
jgi:hypothetical protein